jgi:hypothetical protein
MIVAQALVERGLFDAMVASIWSALQQAESYIGAGNTKWVLIALAVIFGFLFFKPRR